MAKVALGNGVAAGIGPLAGDGVDHAALAIIAQILILFLLPNPVR